MWPATALDDSDWNGNQARGWSVSERLRQRQERLVEASRKREVQSRWAGQFTSVIIIFAQPDSLTMRTLESRREYLNVRTGDTWDAYFAGYYTSNLHELERQVGARRVAQGRPDSWYFNPKDFDVLRREVEAASSGRWRHSGGSDLVALTAWIPPSGAPTLDWASIVSGRLTEPDEGVLTATLSEIVEDISRDLELEMESPDFGTGRLSGPPAAVGDSSAKQVLIGALGGFIAGIGRSAAGL